MIHRSGHRLFIAAHDAADTELWDCLALDSTGSPREARPRIGSSRPRMLELDPEKLALAGLVVDRGSQIAGPVDPPLAPVPAGYAVTKIKSMLGGDGALRQQSVSVKPAPDETMTAAVPDGHVESGRSTLVAADGTVVLQWVKTRAEHPEIDVLRELTESLAHIPRARQREVEGEYLDDLIAVYPIGDPHIGLLGPSGYGLDEGCRLLRDAVDYVVRKGPRTELAVVAALGDTYHSDDPRNRTRRSGHELDVDGLWIDVARAGRDTILGCIESALDHHARVRFIPVIGNHDDLSSVWLGMLVDAYYRDEPRVTVDTTGAPFMWFEWGANLLGFTHGDKCKRAKLPGIMAGRVPEAWGRTIHRFWFTGHIHHSRREEIDGVIVEAFRTLADQDDYARAGGYISGRDLIRIVLHRHHGEVSRDLVNPLMLG